MIGKLFAKVILNTSFNLVFGYICQLKVVVSVNENHATTHKINIKPIVLSI